MEVRAGTRLGPYEVIARLGAGGMGEVWEARDTRLDRSVAIKVLPADFAQDKALKLRLEHEAKTISQLNHPHICVLHDIGSEQGMSYLVMELVHGESLADLIARGPLPMPDLLRYGAQMADALDRAHRAGVVHRDLKPGNVMITRAGVKLLDFGLAKSTALLLGSHSSDDVTQRQPLTAEGMVVGTVQYMAPEQLGGETVDHRTDIFALGAVLYEMATGTRPFAGSNRTSIIAAILSMEPRPITDLQPQCPAAFQHVVSKCLVKDREERWQSAADIAGELRWIGTQPASEFTAITHPARRRAALIPWIVTAVAMAIAALGWWQLRHQPPARVTKTIVSDEIETSWNVAPVISPDGRRIAYPAADALWIRTLDELEPRKVPITGQHEPVLFWSPDSSWLAFVSDGKLWKVSPTGSAPVLIAPLPPESHFHSGAWDAGGRIVLARYREGLYEIPAGGGSAVLILPTGPDLVDFHNLSFLPDGKTLLAVPHKLGSMGTVEVIRGTKRQTVLSFGQATVRGVAFSPPDHLLVSLGGAGAGVWAVPFSLARLVPTGKEFLVAPGAGACSVSSDGSLVFVSNIDAAPRQLVRVDHAGKIVAKIGGVIDGAQTPVVSPDEKLIALSARTEENNWGIELLDVATGGRRRLTNGFSSDLGSSWSHDGRVLLAYRVPSMDWDDPRFGVWAIPVDGSGEPRKIIKGFWSNFTPDDRNIVFRTYAARDRSDIAVIPASGGAAVDIVKSPFPKEDLALSPDGRFLAYTAADTGSNEVYVTRYPSGEGKLQVSRGHARRPVWSHDGRTLFFQSANQVFSSSFAASPALRFGEPAIVFDAAALNINLTITNYNNFDVSRDGTLIAIQDLPTKRQVVLVQNWLAQYQ